MGIDSKYLRKPERINSLYFEFSPISEQYAAIMKLRVLEFIRSHNMELITMETGITVGIQDTTQVDWVDIDNEVDC